MIDRQTERGERESEATTDRDGGAESTGATVLEFEHSLDTERATELQCEHSLVTERTTERATKPTPRQKPEKSNTEEPRCWNLNTVWTRKEPRSYNVSTVWTRKEPRSYNVSTVWTRKEPRREPRSRHPDRNRKNQIQSELPASQSHLRATNQRE